MPNLMKRGAASESAAALDQRLSKVLKVLTSGWRVQAAKAFAHSQPALRCGL
jgi:uncharacterized protein YukE